MTSEQALLFVLFAGIITMLVWGRFRHDFVAIGGLAIAVVLGLVPESKAFEGFASEAVLIVALVLIASRALENSGAIGILTRWLAVDHRSTGAHIAVVSGFGAALSSVINNVAALALLMPLDVTAAHRAGRPPGVTLMPLAYATMLGGILTLIGTPPNIIASSIRAEQLGAPYRMFDFTPVGAVVCVAGLAFIAIFGWRLVPSREDQARRIGREASFRAELLVPEGSPVIGKLGAELDETAEMADVLVVGLNRGEQRLYSRARVTPIATGDILVVEGASDAIAAFIKAAGLQESTAGKDEAAKEPAQGEAVEPAPPAIVEAVVQSDSRLIGRSARSLGLRARFGVSLLAIAHAGIVERERVRDRPIEAGDLLLLSGPGAASDATLALLGTISVSRLSVPRSRPWDVAIAVGLFVGAIAVASFGLMSFALALAIAVLGYALSGLVPPREFYDQIDWPIVVMLACLLPVATAFGEVGGTGLIADAIVDLTESAPIIVSLIAIMLVTMCVSDVLNNVATIVIFAPIAIGLAQRLDVNPDTFLMGVTIATSCSYLTPIGHKNSLLIMGPGGFRFGDYWHMGLPLMLIVLAVAVPMLLIVWPL
jgi:di/tricarboxylate transporter